MPVWLAWIIVAAPFTIGVCIAITRMWQESKNAVEFFGLIGAVLAIVALVTLFCYALSVTMR